MYTMKQTKKNNQKKKKPYLTFKSFASFPNGSTGEKTKAEFV